MAEHTTTGPFVYSMPVRFADTDAQGHMYFANYLTFCDEALGAYMRFLGCPWQDLVAGGVDLVYRAARCDYRGAATFETAIAIEPRFAGVGDTSVTCRFVMRDPDGATLAEVELTSVCVDTRTRTPVEVPPKLREAIAGA